MNASPIELRRVAAALEALRTELDRDRAAAAGGLSTPIETDPEWSAASALRALTAALQENLALISHDVAGAAGAIRTAAEAYQAADDRAAGRLVTLRRGPW